MGLGITCCPAVTDDRDADGARAWALPPFVRLFHGGSLPKDSLLACLFWGPTGLRALGVQTRWKTMVPSLNGKWERRGPGARAASGGRVSGEPGRR